MQIESMMAQTHTMSRSLNVPLHLQQPLHIDTDITYDLDKTKFPGLDDPEQMYQPALLLAEDTRVNRQWNTHGGVNQVPHVAQTHGQTKHHQNRDVLEELLNIIDSCNGELLDRLDTKPDQTHNTSMYKSIVDACGYDSHQGRTYSRGYSNQVVQSSTTFQDRRPVLREMNSIHQMPVKSATMENRAPMNVPLSKSCFNQRAVHGNGHMLQNNFNLYGNSSHILSQSQYHQQSQFTSKTVMQPENVNAVSSSYAKTCMDYNNSCDRSTVKQYFAETHNNRNFYNAAAQSQTFHVPPSFNNVIPESKSIIPVSSGSMKRKRSSDSIDSQLLKRQCFYKTGYTNNSLSGFHHTTLNRGLVV